MKKVVKKTLIYGGSTLVLGGTAAGITIPVLNAQNKVHKSSIPTGLTKESLITGHSTVGDFEKNNDEKGQKETKLLNKAKYQLSFKLYEEEQAASFDFQKADFKYEMYQKAKEAIQSVFDNKKIANDFNKRKNASITTTYDQDFINNPLKINEVEKDFDNFIKWAETQTQKAIDNPFGATDKIKKENKDKANKLKNRLKDLKKEHGNIKEKLDKVIAKNHPDIDFSSSSISSYYPRLMLPLKIIRDKQSKIFDDAKDAYIKTFETKEKGLAEWPKNLVKSYNGSTTKAEAIDYLVSNETQNVAFKRFKYKINSDFTVEKIITGIYNDILGIKKTGFKSLTTPNDKNKLDRDSIVDNKKSTIKTVAPAQETTLFANKDFTSSTDLIKSLQEKVYFLGTESLVTKYKVTKTKSQNFFAPNFNNQDTKNYIDGLIGTKIAKVENAIIGLTPNSEDPQAAWQYGSQIKDKRAAIRNALKLFVIDNNKKSKYITGYNDAEKIFGTDNEISKTLIAEITATQDSSKYKGGDYGWKSQLDNVKGMTAGFGVGLIAAFKDISGESNTTSPTNPIKTTMVGSGFNGKMESVKLLFKAVLDGLNKFIADKGGKKLTYNASPSISDIENYNRTLNYFTNEKVLSDDDILKYIGTSVRKTVNDMKNTPSSPVSIFLDKDLKSTNTLPPVIDLGNSSNGHVYIFTTEEFGMHLVRIVKGKSILGQIELDLAKVADAQDVKEANTDYVSLLNNALTTNKQMEKLLGLKITNGKPQLSSNGYTKFVDDNYKKFNDSNNKYKNANDLTSDIARLLNSLKTADIISKVNSSVPSNYKDWLVKLMDNKIMLEPDKSGLAPEDIYNWAIKEEEK